MTVSRLAPSPASASTASATPPTGGRPRRAPAGEPRHRPGAARGGAGAHPRGGRRGRGEQLPAVPGPDGLRAAAAAHVARLSRVRYDPRTDCVITAGGPNGIINALLATLEPGDEVIITDPIYAGLVNRVLLAGGVPRLRPAARRPAGLALEPAGSRRRPGRTRALLLMSPSMPSGAVLGEELWTPCRRRCARADPWLIFDAAHGAHPLRRPRRRAPRPRSARSPPARSPSARRPKELRLIGWRVGWVVGPPALMADVHSSG